MHLQRSSREGNLKRYPPVGPRLSAAATFLTGTGLTKYLALSSYLTWKPLPTATANQVVVIVIIVVAITSERRGTRGSTEKGGVRVKPVACVFALGSRPDPFTTDYYLNGLRGSVKLQQQRRSIFSGHLQRHRYFLKTIFFQYDRNVDSQQVLDNVSLCTFRTYRETDDGFPFIFKRHREEIELSLLEFSFIGTKRAVSRHGRFVRRFIGARESA